MSSNPARGEVYSIQHYVIQFFTDLHPWSTALVSSMLNITLPMWLYISKVQDEDSAFFTTKLFIQLYVRFGIIFSCGTHFYDRIIWLRGSVWRPNQVKSIYWSIYANECSKRSCMQDLASASMIYWLNFETVLTVRYFLFLILSSNISIKLKCG